MMMADTLMMIVMTGNRHSVPCMGFLDQCVVSRFVGKIKVPEVARKQREFLLFTCIL